MLVNDEDMVTDIATRGATVGNSSLNVLGDGSMGVYLCRHADLLLHQAGDTNSAKIIVFKVCISISIVNK